MGFLGGGFEIEGSGLEFKSSGIGPRQHQQRFDQRFHPLACPQARFESLAVFLGGALARQGQFGVGVNDGERGTQFVGGIGGELNLTLEGFIETVEGVVEGFGQCA